MSYQVIHSFREVVFTGRKVLILCDIDDTLIRWEKNMNDFWMQANTELPTEPIETRQAYAESLWKSYHKNTKPVLTDITGFTDMLNRMPSASKIAFLTARSGGGNEHYTKTHFASVGIPYEPGSVFYTNNEISKGEYIYRFIKTDKYDQVIFIDDLWENIITVKLYCPDIDRYLFSYLRP